MKASDVNAENYYGREANYAFLSNSQRKKFEECPAQWLATILGQWEDLSEKMALFEGQYLDVALTESSVRFARWCEKNSNRIYGRNGKKLKNFIYLDMAIETVRNEPLLMEYLTGQAQTIIALEDFHGVPFRCKLDVLNLVKGFITDLKKTASLYFEQWSPKFMERVSYIDLYEYWVQLALYREAVWLKYNVELPCYIVAVEAKPKDLENSKQVDRQIYHLDDFAYLENEMRAAVTTLHQMQKIKDDALEPDEVLRCEKCAYCIDTKIITKPLPIKPKMRF